jgi:hypothetical protein
MKIHLENLKPAEETFLRGVIQKFTDPKHRPVADYLMSGRLVIKANPAGVPMFVPAGLPQPKTLTEHLHHRD